MIDVCRVIPSTNDESKEWGTGGYARFGNTPPYGDGSTDLIMRAIPDTEQGGSRLQVFRLRE